MTIFSSDSTSSPQEVNEGSSTTKSVSPDSLAGSYAGTKTIRFSGATPSTVMSVGDGFYYTSIPASLDGMRIISVHGEVVTAGITNTADIQLHNVTSAVDILSTKLTIDSGETGSDTAAVPVVINTANNTLTTYDVLRVDIDTVHTTVAQGLMITLECRLP